MTAGELLAKCRHLTLSGINADGELEWIGTLKHWQLAEIEEDQIFSEWELRAIFG